ncbi:MAG: S8 family serine peptidase [Bryobacteraceae bacterium]
MLASPRPLLWISQPALSASLGRLRSETLGDSRVCIAVIDGPADLTHPCFRGARICPLGPADPRSSPAGPASQHGTHVASIIFGQSGSPIEGLAPACSGLILPVFRDGANAVAPCSQIELAHAIVMAVEFGANVINISGGQLEPSGIAHPLLSRALRLCQERDALIVAAVGNDGCACSHVPASHPYVLAVGAADADGHPLPSTNWGSSYRGHGLTAPGLSIPGASPGGGTAHASGASFATAIVSGIAGLLLSREMRRRGNANARYVRAALLADARPNGRPPALASLSPLDLSSTLVQLERGDIAMSDPVAMPDPAAYGAPESAVPALMPAADASVPLEASATAAVQAAACGCQNPETSGAPLRQLVFAIGQLGFDFGTEARRDSIAQHMGADPHDAARLLAYLDENPWDAASIHWTLSQDAVRIYAIRATGAFAEQVYIRLRDFLREQIAGAVEMVSVPGVITGKTTLLSGETVPVISPDLRGMYSWTVGELVKTVAGAPPEQDASQTDRDRYMQRGEGVRNFLERVYHELRNLGLTAAERAINYAATNAFTVNEIFQAAIRDGTELDSIEVVRSPICRPDSDCWDVKLTFFDPERLLERARKTYRFTVDVSDVTPVTVGPVRSWFVR